MEGSLLMHQSCQGVLRAEQVLDIHSFHRSDPLSRHWEGKASGGEVRRWTESNNRVSVDLHTSKEV